MHTRYIDTDDGQSWFINHNGDFSGNILIGHPGIGGYVAELPFDLIRQIVGAYIVHETIVHIEGLDLSDVVKGLIR